MQEIAKQFEKELQDLLDRYKNKLSTPTRMRIAQHVFYNKLSISKHPERFRGRGYAKGFPISGEFEGYLKKWATPRTEANIKKEWIEEEERRKKLEDDWVVSNEGPC